MSKYRFLIVLVAVFSVCVLRISAQDRFMADKVVAVVGNSVVLYSDVVNMKNDLVEMHRMQGVTSDRDPMCEALEKMMVQKLLFNQAQIDSLTIQTDDITLAVQERINEEVAKVGSMKVLEGMYHKPIFAIRADLMKRYEELRYANTMEQTIKSKVKILPGEVERFYKNTSKDSIPLVPEQYEFSQITMFPPSKAEADLRTRERLLEMRERINSGTSFEMLARLYSVDPSSRMRGGEMDPQSKDAFVRPFADALARLRPGQVSEVVETEFGFHIIQLIEKKGNSYHCRHILLRPQFTDEEVEAVFTKLDSLKGEITSGKIRFDEAASKFSDDKYSRNNGGHATNVEYLTMTGNTDAKQTSTRFLREVLNAEDYKVLRTMKNGDISKAFASYDLRGNQSGKIVRLDAVIPSHPAGLKEDYEIIMNIALKSKQDKEFIKWLENKVAGMYMRVDDDFKSCDFQYKFLLK